MERMKEKFEYIYFVHIAKKSKTHVYECRNIKSGDRLGTISWFAPWRQYCFFPAAARVFNMGCLEDIKTFIKDSMEIHQINKRKDK